MRIHRLILAALSIMLPAGCSDSAGPAFLDSDTSLWTDLPSYVATYVAGEGAYQRYGFQLVASFSNEGARTVYLLRCAPDSERPLFQVRGLGFESGYDRAWACVGHDHHLAVAPGEIRVDTLFITGPNAWSGSSSLGRLEGDFQLHYLVSPCLAGCPGQVPDGMGVSNPFHVDVQGR